MSRCRQLLKGSLPSSGGSSQDAQQLATNEEGSGPQNKHSTATALLFGV